MDTTRLPIHFAEFLRLLNSHKVEYLLVGSYAVGFHGYPRNTVDMDIWIEQSPGNADRITAMLEDFGFGDAGLQREWLLQEGKIIRMGIAPNRIELLTSISGVRFEDCKPRGINAKIDGIDVRIISLEDLKTNKRASGRLKDLSDLENLP